MDSALFRLPTQPNPYPRLPSSQVAQTARNTAVSARNTFPSPDSRFPGYAAPLADGRLVTDYRPHCNENVPAGWQFATKEWIQKNTDGIISVSRDRQARMTGAIYGDDKTVVPPPANINTCDPMGCDLQWTFDRYGIGMERADATAPPLFGTFATKPTTAKPPAPHVALTTKFEGGRNTARGREFQRLGNGPVAFRNNHEILQ